MAEMDDAPHTGLLAGGKQRSRAGVVHSVDGFTQTVLQQARAVHDRFHAPQQRHPFLGRLHASEIDADVVTVQAASPAPVRCTDYVEAFSGKPGR
jgi:hypothetical protein